MCKSRGQGGGDYQSYFNEKRVGEARAIRATSMSSRCPSPDEGHVFRDVGEGGVIIRASSVWEVGGGGGWGGVTNIRATSMTYLS